MDIHIEVQCLDFFRSILAGVILAFGYDFLRIFRYCFKISLWVTNILDTVFAFFAALFCFCVVLIADAAVLRYFIFLGIIIGIILYELTLSPLLIKSATTTINTIAIPIIKVFNYIFSRINIIKMEILIKLKRILKK